jgi:serine/threonine protein kinase
MNRQRYAISPLFGEIAMNLGLCQPSQIVDALCLQEEQRGYGLTPERIGQILIQRGHLTLDQVRQIMEEVEARTKSLDLPGFDALELVSRDSTTQIYTGVELGTHRTVAIKILRFGLAEAEQERDRIREESRRLALLHHPNLVQLLSEDELEGIPYLVLDYVPGPDLQTHVEENGPLEEEQALNTVAEVAAGLDHAHANRVVHGALRPNAILLPREGGAKVTNFSFSDGGETVAEGASRNLTTPYYYPPEQFRRSGRPSIRSDVYSLGATLFFLLTGRPPFRGTYQEVVNQHLKKPAPDPRVLSPTISRPTALLITGMMEKTAERRPAGMDQVLASVKRIVGTAGETVAPERAMAGMGRILNRKHGA